MTGLPADYYNWKKMPRKEGDRIPMKGQGFSKMLLTLNHNNSESQLDNPNSKTFYTPEKGEEGNIINESALTSRNTNVRSSMSKLDKDGSTTIENSMLPSIKKKRNISMMK
mmetsp:Transcript_38486/g.37996  ORF Transcript_38486/g.37996 Transcript_38486/m.37996 type:complete len:111 (+) Transcript_38486:2054-2386(+)